MLVETCVQLFYGLSLTVKYVKGSSDGDFYAFLSGGSWGSGSGNGVGWEVGRVGVVAVGADAFVVDVGEGGLLFGVSRLHPEA